MKEARMIHWLDPEPMGVSYLSISMYGGVTGQWEFSSIEGEIILTLNNILYYSLQN